jgi:hypothetical protein
VGAVSRRAEATSRGARMLRTALGIRASAVEAVSLLMIDPLHFVVAMQGIPSSAFVGVDDGALGDARLDE